MALSPQPIYPNTGRRAIKTPAVRLSDVASAATTDYAEILCGDGAPSGGYGRASGATMLYVRKDASGVSTAVYVTVNGGTNWTAMDPAALNGFDLNGTELILDADGNSSITADTDDQIDVKIGGADDFQFTANTFTALSGSTVATNTIAETTAASGVTVDGLLIKDNIAQGTNLTDPGNAGAIPVTKSGSVPIVSAGAETRTLAIPTAIGQTLTIYFKTDGGDCVVTVASAINATGNNTITLNDANDSITLIGVHNGTALCWRVLVNDGTTLSTV